MGDEDTGYVGAPLMFVRGGGRGRSQGLQLPVLPMLSLLGKARHFSEPQPLILQINNNLFALVPSQIVEPLQGEFFTGSLRLTCWEPEVGGARRSSEDPAPASASCCCLSRSQGGFPTEEDAHRLLETF